MCHALNELPGLEYLCSIFLIFLVYSKILQINGIFSFLSFCTLATVFVAIKLAHVIRSMKRIKSVGKIINRIRNSNEIHLQFKMEPYPPNQKYNEINNIRYQHLIQNEIHSFDKMNEYSK